MAVTPPYTEPKKRSPRGNILMSVSTNPIALNARAGWMGWWPGLRSVLDPENGRIRSFLKEESAILSNGSKVLDASAGARPYAFLFQHQQYESCDVPGGFYRCSHDFECYLDNIPRPDHFYDAIVLTQVLEHVPNPELVLWELGRITKQGGKLLISVPLNGPLHGEPWHFFQFTHHGLLELARKTNWEVAKCEKIGGAFWFLSKHAADLPKRLMKSVDPLRAKKRGKPILVCILWTTALLPIWLISIPIIGFIIRPLCYWLDLLDIEKTLTSGYTAVFVRNAYLPHD